MKRYRNTNFASHRHTRNLIYFIFYSFGAALKGPAAFCLKKKRKYETERTNEFSLIAMLQLAYTLLRALDYRRLDRAGRVKDSNRVIFVPCAALTAESRMRRMREETRAHD